jgi:hypothetical protein
MNETLLSKEFWTKVLEDYTAPRNFPYLFICNASWHFEHMYRNHRQDIVQLARQFLQETAWNEVAKLYQDGSSTVLFDNKDGSEDFNSHKIRLDFINWNLAKISL